MYSSEGVSVFSLYLEAVPVLPGSHILTAIYPSSTYGHTPTQESTLCSVIEYKTIPFTLPGEIPFMKLSLSQTFTSYCADTTLFLPLSLSLSFPWSISLSSFQIPRQQCWEAGLARQVCSYQLLPWGMASGKSSFSFKHPVWVQQLDPEGKTEIQLFGYAAARAQQAGWLYWPSGAVGSDDEAWLITCWYQRREGHCMSRELRSWPIVPGWFQWHGTAQVLYYSIFLPSISAISCTLQNK